MFKRCFLYFVPLCLLASHQLLQKFNLSSSFLRSYLDDFLVVPAAIGLWLFVAQLFKAKTDPIDLWIAAISGIFFFSLLFEVILPAYLQTTTRDYWDLLAYSMGAFSYLLLLEFTPKPKRA